MPDEQPASQLCWRSCNEDPDCIAYVHLLDTDECYGYSYFERSSRYLPIGHDLPLVADGEAMFYEKTCLRGSYCCCSGSGWACSPPTLMVSILILFCCSARGMQRSPLVAHQNSREQSGVPWQKDHFHAGHAP